MTDTSENAYLSLVRDDRSIGQVLPLNAVEKNRLGRNRDCLGFFLFDADSSISRNHAEIYFEAGTWFVQDLRSTNGTFVNDEKVLAQPHQLGRGDLVRFGKNTTFVFSSKRLDGGVVIRNELDDETLTKSGERITGLDPIRDPLPALCDLYRIALRIISAPDQATLVAITLDAMLERCMHATVAVLVEVDDGQPRAVASQSRSAEPATPQISRGLVDHVISSGKAITAEHQDREHLLRNEEQSSDPPCCAICVPIPADGAAMLFYMYSTDPKNTPEKFELEYAIALAKLFVAMSARLRRLGAQPVAPAPALESDKPLLRPLEMEKARVELREIARVLDKVRWKKGEASQELYGNRFRLTRVVSDIFAKFPDLAREPEFSRIADDFI